MAVPSFRIAKKLADALRWYSTPSMTSAPLGAPFVML